MTEEVSGDDDDEVGGFNPANDAAKPRCCPPSGPPPQSTHAEAELGSGRSCILYESKDFQRTAGCVWIRD